MGGVKVWIGLWALASFGFAAQAASSEFEGKRIDGIQFSGVQPLDARDLARAQPLKIGQPLRTEDVAHAIDSLFATGRFADIAVEAEAAGSGVVVRFVTENTTFIGDVSLAGKVTDSPTRGQALQALNLSLGSAFHQEDVTHAVESLKRLLKSNGLYEAEVTPSVTTNEKSQLVSITFQIAEGKRAKYELPLVQGETNLTDDALARITGWRIPLIHWWRKVTDGRTRKGVQSLLAKFQSQGHLTARVELDKLDYDPERLRVRPNLTVAQGPQVKITAVEAKVSRRLLKRYVPVFQERSVDNDLLVEGRRNLLDYFQSQGYYDADVDFRVQPVKENVETIEYVIARGPRYKLSRVAVSGNTYFKADTLQERMFTAPAAFTLRHGRYSEAFLRKDQDTLSALYRDNGFRDVKITPMVDRQYQGIPGRFAVTFHVEEGPQWIVDRLDIRGVTQVNLAELEAGLTSSVGQPFSDGSLGLDRTIVLNYYYAHGFPAATFTASWQLTGTPHHVNVVYDVSEGEPQYVRGVIVSGLKITRPKLANKYLTLKSGDPLSPEAEADIQRRFYDLGIFARVDAATENPDGDTEFKNVLYNFEEANRYTFSVGFGAQLARFGTPSTTSLASPAGTTGFSPSVSLTATRLNFLGLGHTVSLRGAYSSIEKLGSLSYLQPRFRDVDGRNITYTLLYDSSLDVRTFASQKAEGSVQLSQRFSKSLNGLFQFSYRRVSVSRVVIPELLIPQLAQPVRIGIISATLIQDRRDNPADSHHGIYTTVNFGLADKYLGSQRGFGRVLIRNATYYSLTKNLVLARQTQFGVIAPFSPPAGLSAQESVPLPERFFGGGADTLRAFPYNQAGPRDIGAPTVAGGASYQPTGFPLGGNALFFNNVELRFPLIGSNIKGVLFHDMGNVYSSVGKFSLRFHQHDLQDFNYGVHAVGFGVRYQTPVGPIRGDLAYSVNPPSFVGFKGTAEQLLQCNPSVSPSSLPSYCQGVPQGISHFQFFFSIGQTF
ncbi:MAG: BamA/TamA family outer membrane protein [Acidobacteriota bacterium]|nr:BamA/TamA family outer membrane protein [Acidobacteriota bacterium]